MRGSALLELLLYVIFLPVIAVTWMFLLILLPLSYTAWRRPNKRTVCLNCESVGQLIPIDSPKGQKIITENNLEDERVMVEEDMRWYYAIAAIVVLVGILAVIYVNRP